MKKILILGGNGFIGRNLVEYFEDYSDEYSVTAPSSTQLNLIDEKAVLAFLKKEYFDVVINAAICNPIRLERGKTYNELDSNLRMFFNLSKWSKLFGKMIYFGSGAEYDKSMSISNVDESTFDNGIPLSDYGFSKYIIGKEIENSPNIFNLRIFGLFGKYENWRTTFISGACCKALKNLPITIRQNVFFDYLFIDDFCKIVKWFVDNEPHYKSYNVTSGTQRDLISIAHIVNKVCEKDVPIYICKDGLANEYSASNERLLNEIGEFRFIGFEQAVKCLVEYYASILDEIDIYSLLYQ